MPAIIALENVSKYYRLGTIGGGTLRGDLQRWWARQRGKEDPLLKIGQEDHRNREGEYIWALRDINFQVEAGEVLGIIGRNGAGKSTLLKILSRVTAPTSGIIKVDGRIASLLEVGTGFHPELTGRENIYLNGAILGMNRAEVKRKLGEIVAFSEVEQFIDTPVKRYSNGMYVRLAFAVAAHLDPDILIVDEVLAVGDTAFQKKCLGKMSDVASQGRTVLFVSHNLGSVQSLCTKCILLTRGSLQMEGEVSQVVSTYLSSMESKDQDGINEERRSGKGEIRLRKVELRDGIGQNLPVVQAGQSVDFVFTIEELEPGIQLQFTIYDMNGAPVASFNSAVSSSQDKEKPELEDKLICHIEEMPLIAGRYRLNTSISTGHDLQDHIEGAFFFSVEQGIINGRPVKGSSRYGNVHIKHLWSKP